jgi:DNA ligase-1
MRLAEVAHTSRRVAEVPGRLDKIGLLADLLRRLTPEEVAIVVPWLAGDLRQGRIGIGPAAVRGAVPDDAAAEGALTVREVDGALADMAALSGAGSQTERGRRLRGLLARGTQEEQSFLVRLLLGELRQGALEGVMAEAIARAADVPAGDVRRAVMLAGDAATVAAAALGEGAAGLARFGLQLFRPVQPMLAQTAEDPGDALGRLGTAALEYKLDGARVQAHKAGDEVRVYSRRLNEVTAAVPEVVEAVRALPARDLVLDGETLALRPDGAPHAFQTTMRRFGRRLDVDALRRELPLSVFFFDCLHRDGEDLLHRPATERAAALAGGVPAGLVVPRLVTADPAAAGAFLEAALTAGHEGVMAKSLEAAYEAGGRGAAWLKVKPAHTLDLVVLAAEWGSGRRRGWLSNLHLGARDPATGGFVMLGKTFKGLTDALLAWQTERLLALEVARDEWTVYVRPALVVEIAFDGLQASPHYPGGLALRFARVKRYRSDKTAADADTIETVRSFYRG